MTVNTAGEVAVWDIVRGVCLGRYRESEVAVAVSGVGVFREGVEGEGEGGGGGEGSGVAGSAGSGAGSGAGSTKEEGIGVGANGGERVMSAMGMHMVGENSPREVLEAVRELIEGQAVIAKWASVETRGGVLVVHLNERCFEVEVYADELGYTHEKGLTEETKCELAAC